MKESYQITNNPKYSAAAAAADEFVLAHWIGSSSCFRCLRAGPLHMHLQQLPIAHALWQLQITSCWPNAYAIAAAADIFEWAHCIGSCCCCQCLRVGQYTAAPTFTLAHCICDCSSCR